MKKCICIALSLLSSLAYSQDYSWEQALFSNSENQPSTIYRMAISDTDEKVVVGKFKESMTIGEQTINSSKPLGVFLAKYTANDSLLWVKVIAESEEHNLVEFIDALGHPKVICDELGYIYVNIPYNDTLYTNSNEYISNDLNYNFPNFIILKYSIDGDEIFTLDVKGDCEKRNGVKGFVVADDKSIYLSVMYGNNIFNNTQLCDCIIGNDTLRTYDYKSVLVKYSSSGLVLWSKKNTGDADVILLNQESLYASGYSYNANNIDFDNYTIHYPSSYEQGAYIAQFDTTGIFKWATYFGVKGWASHVQIMDLYAATDNDIILVGRTFAQDQTNKLFFENASTLIGSQYGSDDAFIVCYDSLGNVKWHEMTNSHSDEWYVESTSDSDGNIFVSGTFAGELVLGTDTLVSTGGYEVFIRAFDNEGNHLWVKKAGGTSSDFCYGLEIDSQENLYMVGSSASNLIHFGDSSYSLPPSGYQMFLAKLSKNSIGLKELLNKEALVYPNPTTGTFTIESELSVTKLEIYSVLGELVYTKNYSSKTKEVQISKELGSGAYFVLLSLENGQQSVEKIIVN